MEPAAYATYKLQIQGLFFLGLILGTVFAEIFFSGRLSDWLMLRLAKRNNGVRLPEMRLWLGYPAAVLSSVGLLVWGLSVDREWHWITGQIAFFLCEFDDVMDCGRYILMKRYRWCGFADREHSTEQLHRRQLLRTCYGYHNILYSHYQRKSYPPVSESGDSKLTLSSALRLRRTLVYQHLGRSFRYVHTASLLC